MNKKIQTILIVSLLASAAAFSVAKADVSEFNIFLSSPENCTNAVTSLDGAEIALPAHICVVSQIKGDTTSTIYVDLTTKTHYVNSFFGEDLAAIYGGNSYVAEGTFPNLSIPRLDIMPNGFVGTTSGMPNLNPPNPNATVVNHFFEGQPFSAQVEAFLYDHNTHALLATASSSISNFKIAPLGFRTSQTITNSALTAVASNFGGVFPVIGKLAIVLAILIMAVFIVFRVIIRRAYSGTIVGYTSEERERK